MILIRIVTKGKISRMFLQVFREGKEVKHGERPKTNLSQTFVDSLIQTVELLNAFFLIVPLD